MRFDLSRPLFPQTSADPPTDHVRAGDDDIYVILPAVTDGPSSPLVLAIFGRFFNVYNLVCMEIQETNHLRLWFNNHIVRVKDLVFETESE